MSERPTGTGKPETELRLALERGELELHYQPQVDLDHGGTLCGFEALVRWRHPERGLLPPSDFIPLAERSGLIDTVGEWVLQEACRQAKAWIETFNPALRMAVNVSARQFNKGDLAQRVGRVLRQTGLPPANLELELTETLIMQDIDRSTRALFELKAMGVAIAVDDFGTGYSSLAYLTRFPIDILKIDRSFVSDLSRDANAASICASIIAMAHAVRIAVVAEGVEDKSQLGFLMQRCCNRVQGYLFGAPQAAVAATALLGSPWPPEFLPTFAAAEQDRVLLLLDDEPNILSALKRLFRRDGYRILAATCAAEAYELLASNKVGVVIADQRMPQITGTEFLRQVKQLYPDTTRIVLSGYTDLRTVIEAINEGAIYRFLTKPWNDVQLRKAIRDAFQQQELVQENIRLAEQFREASARLAEANEQLQALIDVKAQRIARDEVLIETAQEVFHRVPVPLLGIDDDGMIVLVNEPARRHWPAAAPGAEAARALPDELIPAAADDRFPRSFDVGSCRYVVHRERLHRHAGGRGWLFTLLPAACPLGAAQPA